ncbi:MAG: DUF853 family protein, partial [Asticcacaulis sp.]|nr:DUF853 family protein [Asticcacaulis sp.]
LGVGEALVSLLDEKGRPNITEKALIRPPASRFGPVTDAERAAIRAGSPVGAAYDTAIDRQSAYEILAGRAGAVQAAQPETESTAGDKAAAKAAEQAARAEEHARLQAEKDRARATQQTIKTVTSVAVPIIRSMGIMLGRELLRGMMGNSRRR